MQWRATWSVLPVVFALACGSSVAAVPDGDDDGAASDAGDPQHGEGGGEDGEDADDAGSADAGSADSGSIDAGSADAGSSDAAGSDADAGCSAEARLTCLADEDNDRYAAGANVVQLCPDPSRALFGDCPAGYVAPDASLGVDCDDADGARFQNVSARLDGDGDGYCAGAPFDACVGVTVPAGQREAAACQAADDCDDANAMAYRAVSLRPDADGDGFCAAAISTQCIGATVPAGMRLAETCDATTDCKDTNPHATSTCSYVVSSTVFLKSCGVGSPATQSGTVSVVCTTGFRVDGLVGVNNSDGNVTTCSAAFASGNATQTVTQTCNFAATGASTCYLSVACVAN